MPDSAMLVLTTFPDESSFQQLAEEVLSEKLAACITSLPHATSRYYWEGKLEVAQETLCFIKTLQQHVPKLMEILKTHHPYECPEILALEADKIEPAYQQWLSENTK